MRSDAVITVTCDRCKDWKGGEEIQLTATAHGWDERYVDDELERRGWKIVDGDDICPSCVEKIDGEESED